MKKIICVITTTLFTYTMVFAQTNPLFRYLPHNTGMVMSFNPVTLANKVPGETFRQSALYRQMMKKDDGELRAFMSDPSVSGIDFSQDLLLTTVTDTSSQYTGVTVNVFGVLKNEALFALLINKRPKGKDSLHIYGTNKMLLSENGGPAIAWNNEVFVFTTGSTSGRKAEMMKIFADTTDTRDLDIRLNEFNATSKKIQRDNCFELLTPKFQNPFIPNGYYTQVMNQPGDIKIWSNGSGFGSSIPRSKMPYLITGVISKLQSLSGTSKTSIINFENGKIAAYNHNYVNEEIAAIYKKYPSSTLQTDMVSRLPQGALLGLFMTSAQPAMAKEMIQRMGLNELIDSVKKNIPFDMNLLTGVFGNNAMLAVMNIPVPVKDTLEEGRRKLFDGIQVIMAVPIASKEKFEALKNVVGNMIDSLKATKTGEKMMKGIQPAVKYNDSLCVFSLSEETAGNFLANKGTGTVPEWLQQNTGYPMVMSLNLKEMLNMFLLGKADPGSAKDQETQKITGFFDRILITGGNYESGSVQSKMEFRFSNTNENAFLQLFNLVNMIADDKEAKSKAKTWVPEGNHDPETTLSEIKQEKKNEPPPPPPPPSQKHGKLLTPPVKKTKG